MVSLMIVMINECPDLRFKVSRKEVVFQQDAVFQDLVPSSPQADKRCVQR